MDFATISLIALLVAVVLSCVTQVNVGFVAVALAWILGVFVGRSLARKSASKECSRASILSCS